MLYIDVSTEISTSTSLLIGTDRLVAGGFKFRRSAFRGSEPKVTLIAAHEGQGVAFNLLVNADTPGRAQKLFEAKLKAYSREIDIHVYTIY